jgi:hypothetical protein
MGASVPKELWSIADACYGCFLLVEMPGIPKLIVRFMKQGSKSVTDFLCDLLQVSSFS